MKRYHMLLLLLGLIALGIVGTMDMDAQQSEDEFYCDMVRVWKENLEVPQRDRPGWPPYRNDITCEALAATGVDPS